MREGGEEAEEGGERERERAALHTAPWKIRQYGTRNWKEGARGRVGRKWGLISRLAKKCVEAEKKERGVVVDRSQKMDGKLTISDPEVNVPRKL